MTQESALTSRTGKARPLSRKKRWLFRLLLMMIVWCTGELLAFITLKLMITQGSLALLKEAQRSIASGANTSDGASEAIHPYLGWVHNPQISQPGVFEGRDIKVNSLGFLDNGPAVRHRSAETCLIGITGGSVAWQFSWETEDRLREQLSTWPELKGRRVELIRLAMPGYKQPQQLIALNYVMALGGEFDAIINIDGFNDGVLSLQENVQHGTALDYPRSWHARALVMTDPAISDQAFELFRLRAGRQSRAKDALSSKLRWSPMYQLIWHLRDESARRSLLDLGLEVSRSNQTSFVHHGPKPVQKSAEEHRADAVALWSRSSEQMHALCRARGIPYLHVLQPNQYVAGSKPLTEYEKEFCFATGQPLADTTAAVYPELIDAGAKLRERGVAFTDQTRVFQSVDRTLYVDPWCHFNSDGNALLADAITEEFRKLIPESGQAQ